MIIQLLLWEWHDFVIVHLLLHEWHDFVIVHLLLHKWHNFANGYRSRNVKNDGNDMLSK